MRENSETINYKDLIEGYQKEREAEDDFDDDGFLIDHFIDEGIYVKREDLDKAITFREFLAILLRWEVKIKREVHK